MISKIKNTGKLILLLDLDNTILHASLGRNISKEQREALFKQHGKEMAALQWGNVAGMVKFRPHLFTFLEEIRPFYEIYVYTAGTKQYAFSIIKAVNERLGFELLSEERTMARETDADKMLVKRISAIFPTQVEMCVILDDNYQIWKDKDNLINVLPYVFFRNENEGRHPLVAFEEGEHCLKEDFDFSLNCLSKLLVRLNTHFFEKNASVMEQIRSLRMNMLANLSFSLELLDSNLFRNSYEYFIIQYFNGAVKDSGVKLSNLTEDSPAESTSLALLYCMFSSWTAVGWEEFSFAEVGVSSVRELVGKPSIQASVVEQCKAKYS